MQCNYGKVKICIGLFKKYLTKYVIQNQLMFADYRAYIINMKIPYETRKVEGGPLCLQWTCIILDVKIQLWYLVTKNIVNLYSSHSNSSETYNIIFFETNIFHIHYDPLTIENNGHTYNVQCAKELGR